MNLLIKSIFRDVNSSMDSDELLESRYFQCIQSVLEASSVEDSLEYVR